MATYSTQNLLDQQYDISGSILYDDNINIASEPLKLGAPNDFPGTSGTDGEITLFDANSNIATFTSTTLITTNINTEQFIYITNGSSNNNGYYSITTVNPSSLEFLIGTADIATGLTWKIYTEPQSLETDLNYMRTDRKLIKGTTNWYDPVTATTTADNATTGANLSNLSSTTTANKAVIVSEIFYGATIAENTTNLDMNVPGQLTYATNTISTGIPISDILGNIYYHDVEACFVGIFDSVVGNQLQTSNGRIVFGLTSDASNSPDYVRITFYSAPIGEALSWSNITPYTWEAPSIITGLVNFAYPKAYSWENVQANAFRRPQAAALIVDADLRHDIDNLQSVVGGGDEATTLSGLITNTTNYFALAGFGVGQKSVIQAINALNNMYGDFNWSAAKPLAVLGTPGALGVSGAPVGTFSTPIKIENVAPNGSYTVENTTPATATGISSMSVSQRYSLQTFSGNGTDGVITTPGGVATLESATLVFGNVFVPVYVKIEGGSSNNNGTFAVTNVLATSLEYTNPSATPQSGLTWSFYTSVVDVTIHVSASVLQASYYASNGVSLLPIITDPVEGSNNFTIDITNSADPINDGSFYIKSINLGTGVITYVNLNPATVDTNIANIVWQTNVAVSAPKYIFTIAVDISAELTPTPTAQDNFLVKIANAGDPVNNGIFPVSSLGGGYITFINPIGNPYDYANSSWQVSLYGFVSGSAVFKRGYAGSNATNVLSDTTNDGQNRVMGQLWNVSPLTNYTLQLVDPTNPTNDKKFVISSASISTPPNGTITFANIPGDVVSAIDTVGPISWVIDNLPYSGGGSGASLSVTHYLQELANYISNAQMTRHIERTTSIINPGDIHTLPGGLTYTTDGGQNLWVFVRGVLRDPGTNPGDSYAETSATEIQFYITVKEKDHINYFKQGV